MTKMIKDLGMLDVHPTKGTHLKTRQRYAIWECPTCLKEYSALTNNVKRGMSTQCKSCGVAARNTKHGCSVRGKKDVLYNRWLSMKNRCGNPNNSSYAYYGGKGVSVCDEWLDYTVFREWAMSNGYSKELSIDRINVDGNYSPDNCRYVVGCVQAANVNKRTNNTTGYKGVIKKGNRWATQIGVKGEHLFLGSYGTPMEAATAYNNYVLQNDLPHRLNKTVIGSSNG